MVFGAMLVGGMVGNYAARRHYESMSAAQEQQEQIDQAKAQAAQAAEAAQAAHAQVTQATSKNKNDMFQQLEKLASLKQQGILTEDEFQKMKARLLSSI
ncbi:MAG: SHOCT domain-containing protein [Nitrososphaeraceae archaeon]|nr:SHOCT domain-containing protein [Nitrososphaeraceae archaeon]MBV9669268.1 SHOCT domain-containing protein [Nitrososphaeraceae archaeon]